MRNGVQEQDAAAQKKAAQKKAKKKRQAEKRAMAEEASALRLSSQQKLCDRYMAWCQAQAHAQAHRDAEGSRVVVACRGQPWPGGSHGLQ